MTQPIPANSHRPLVPGDRVRILPEFQDQGDDDFERIVVEAPPDSSRVLIRTLIPGLNLQPTERIEASMLMILRTLEEEIQNEPEAAIARFADQLTPEQRVWCVENHPAATLKLMGGKLDPVELDLCVQKHPTIPLMFAADRLTEEHLLHLSEDYSFATLLYAAHRLPPEILRATVARHPGECIIILERHPESPLRQALQPIRSDVHPKVAAALAITLTPGG